MRYLLSWRERPNATAGAYEAAQRRCVRLLDRWRAPGSLRTLLYLKRVADFGGYALVECDDPQAIHRWTTVFAVLEFRLEPVLEVTDAVVAELSALEWREAACGGGPDAQRGT